MKKSLNAIYYFTFKNEIKQTLISRRSSGISIIMLQRLKLTKSVVEMYTHSLHFVTIYSMRLDNPNIHRTTTCFACPLFKCHRAVRAARAGEGCLIAVAGLAGGFIPLASIFLLSLSHSHTLSHSTETNETSLSLTQRDSYAYTYIASRQVFANRHAQTRWALGHGPQFGRHNCGRP